VARYYNEGNYKKALKGFRKLVKFSDKLRFYLIPYIEKGENVLKKPTKEKKFIFRKNMIRCKYCGHYTHIETQNKKYHPHHFIPSFAFSNLCISCGKWQPEPSIIWDSWDGLEIASDLELNNADDLNTSLYELINLYPKEYKEWINFRNTSYAYKSFFLVDKNNWLEYQIKILKSIIETIKSQRP